MMLLSRSLRLGAIMVVVFIVSFGASRLVMRARPAVRAFTLKTEVHGFPDGQPATMRHHRTVAVRSDGTRATVVNLGGEPGRAGEEERIVAFLDGRTVAFYPGISAITTIGPRAEMAAARSARLLSPPQNCAFPGWEFAGRDTIAGEPAVITKHVSDPLGWSATDWAAPALGCEQLQYQSYQKQLDGTYKLSTEMRTTSLVFGEPDAQLFDTASSGYREMKPSDVTKTYAKKYNHTLTPEDMKRLEDADKNYFGTLRPQHSTKPQGR